MSSEDASLVRNITLENIDDDQTSTPKPPPRHNRHRHNNKDRLANRTRDLINAVGSSANKNAYENLNHDCIIPSSSNRDDADQSTSSSIFGQKIASGNTTTNNSTSSVTTTTTVDVINSTNEVADDVDVVVVDGGGQHMKGIKQSIDGGKNDERRKNGTAYGPQKQQQQQQPPESLAPATTTSAAAESSSKRVKKSGKTGLVERLSSPSTSRLVQLTNDTGGKRIVQTLLLSSAEHGDEKKLTSTIKHSSSGSISVIRGSTSNTSNTCGGDTSNSVNSIASSTSSCIKLYTVPENSDNNNIQQQNQQQSITATGNSIVKSHNTNTNNTNTGNINFINTKSGSNCDFRDDSTFNRDQNQLNTTIVIGNDGDVKNRFDNRHEAISNSSLPSSSSSSVIHSRPVNGSSSLSSNHLSSSSTTITCHRRQSSLSTNVKSNPRSSKPRAPLSPHSLLLSTSTTQSAGKNSGVDNNNSFHTDSITTTSSTSSSVINCNSGHNNNNKFKSIGNQLPKTVKSVKKIGVFYSDLCEVLKSNVRSSSMKSNPNNQHNSINYNNNNLIIGDNVTTELPAHDENVTNNIVTSSHINNSNTNIVTSSTILQQQANGPNGSSISPDDPNISFHNRHSYISPNPNPNAHHPHHHAHPHNPNPNPHHHHHPNSSHQHHLTNLPDILNSIPPYHSPPPPPYSTLPPPNSTPSSRTNAVAGSPDSRRQMLGQIINSSNIATLTSSGPNSLSPPPPPLASAHMSTGASSPPPPPPPHQPMSLSYCNPATITTISANNNFNYLSAIPPPPHTTARHHHSHHHHHHGLPYLRPGCSRESDVETNTSKSCLTCSGLSIRWFILLISFIGLICAVIGTFLGAARPTGKEHLTLALLMIGVGIVLITVSGIAWRLTSTGPTWRALFGFSELPPSTVLNGNSLESTSRRFLPRVPAPHGRSGAHHHPYGAMFYPEFQYRPPPPSYQASMQEYRLRLLLLERSSSHPPLTTSSPVSPPPTYRSSAASSLAGTLNRAANESNNINSHNNINSTTTTSSATIAGVANSIATGATLRPMSRPPSYRSIISDPIQINSHNVNKNDDNSVIIANNNSLRSNSYSTSRLSIVDQSCAPHHVTSSSPHTSQNITSPGLAYKDDVNRVTIHQTTTTSQVCTPNGVNIVAISPVTSERLEPVTISTSSIDSSCDSNSSGRGGSSNDISSSKCSTSNSSDCGLSQSVNSISSIRESLPLPTSHSVIEGSEVQILAHV
ncbi:uncharacterized protein LOC141850458 isoform X2 [Brevipalpus obovatus]|uniref:uncharacterized protein LOC141850458 isoform X2 n=1 Tax=Brevipalpus obovatus TaxID=246614 RepID=UPI003D9DBCEE